MRIMYDSVDARALPAGAPLYLGYVDRYGDGGMNYQLVRARFPNAIVVPVSVHGADALVGDVENGALSPAGAVTWARRQRARGVDPTVYMAVGSWPAVRHAFHVAGEPEPHYFTAHYTNVEHIDAGAVATQWGGRDHYDISAVADFWPGVDPTPAPAPPVWGPIYPEDHMQPINVQVTTDGNGNGYTDIAGLDPAKVISVIDNAANPPTSGYQPLPRAGRLNIGGQTRVVLEAGPPNGIVDVTVWSV